MNKKMSGRPKYGVWVLLLVAVVLVLIGIQSSRARTTDQETVFWEAVESALTTKGVQRSIDLSTAGTTQILVTNLSFSPGIASETVASYRIPGGQEVVSRARSFPGAEYAVFEKVANAEDPRLQRLEGIWTQTGANDVIAGALADSLTNGTVIFSGNLPKDKRVKLVELMKSTKLYSIASYSSKKTYDSRSATVYKVQMDQDAYNIVLQSYFRMIGMSRYAEQVPTADSDAPKLEIEIAIDPKTGQIYETGYPSLGIPGSHRYSLWGYAKQISPPLGALSASELDALLGVTIE